VPCKFFQPSLLFESKAGGVPLKGSLPYSLDYYNVRNKLECLCLTSLSSLV
jgi:hypothetical protein